MPDLDDRHWLQQAIDLSRSCPPTTTAFSVGAIIVSSDREVLSTGYSRETDPHDHAEEIALTKIPANDPRLPHATFYTSLEPCSKRASRPQTCTQLILAAAIPRVVLAWREPTIFVDCEGVELLEAAGVAVVELPDLAQEVKEINANLLD
ncbi:diaminohydroxyphosphoribosylaminopyrimidine deaminase [Kribbella steppae]|uniref:Diaminohydroxyphosphoribosylaminopyrimidine deaminase n=1 Tax=Kribbella steppae TaxID=2512223 RepID=A0A4R2HNW7_9ACTN|nr:deaminase [Kribbella steppae]TCO32883.1 diaminohydroxyphosphoribosylaminopyrimidine deaminase [Kribbella steppae]